MGLFKHKKKEEKPQETETPGWTAISSAFEAIYPDQRNPRHYGTMISWRLGGNDPLDGISIYETKDYFHFVTFGLSELYEKESENKDYSGYGFEFTLKLKRSSLSNEEDEIRCICGVLQALARMTFEKGEIFQPNEYIYTGQTTGIDATSSSKITGFITTLDEVGEIHTPNGLVQFVQLIGMQDQELKAIIDKKINVQELLAMLPDTLTDYTRDSLL